MPTFFFQIVHPCVSTHNVNAYCVSTHNVNAYKVLSDSYKYFTFCSNICLLTSMISYVFFDAGHICFLLIIPTTFETVLPCVPIHNDNAYEVLSGRHNYFTWVAVVYMNTQ